MLNWPWYFQIMECTNTFRQYHVTQYKKRTVKQEVTFMVRYTVTMPYEQSLYDKLGKLFDIRIIINLACWYLVIQHENPREWYQLAHMHTVYELKVS